MIYVHAGFWVLFVGLVAWVCWDVYKHTPDRPDYDPDEPNPFEDDDNKPMFI